ncbi:MAG: Fe-S cluster assembly sulfur transfer protein SufU [Opitutales bacterium]
MNDENALLKELYQATILEHNKEPRHYGILPDYNEIKEGYNPLCGDKITFYLKRSEEGKIVAASFECAACAICKASTSILLEKAMQDKFRHFEVLYAKAMAHLEGNSAQADSPSDEFAALGAVRAFPSRVNCARLPWDTLKPE